MTNDIDDQDEFDIDDEFPWEDITKCLKNNESSVNGKTVCQMRENLRSFVTHCPKCKKPFDELSVIYFKSPPDTWSQSCGTCGWMVLCLGCKQQIYYKAEEMS